ncbi:hypothetical protein [Micromonospora arborensis]
MRRLIQGAAVLAATDLALAGLGEYVVLLWVLPVVAAGRRRRADALSR